MPELAYPTARVPAPGVELLAAEAALWPWISRFFWQPALDLHPLRRAALLNGWPAAAWQQPAVLAQLSRHLLREAEPMPAWHSGSSAFRLALLPQEPLARLARRIGLTLAGAGAAGLADEEVRFLAQRAPLYWRAAPSWEDPQQSGWANLRAALAEQSAGVQARFAWKTAPAHGRVEVHNGAAMLALALRILREFEEPWSCLFIAPVR